MSEPRRKTIGPRRPCPCSVCNGAMKSLTTIRNHRLRDQNEPEDATITNNTANKETKHNKKPSQGTKSVPVQLSTVTVAAPQSSVIPAAPLPNVPQNSSPMIPDYRTLQVAYLSLQQRCLTLERELYIERLTKGQLIKHLDHLVEVLAPRPPRAYGQLPAGNFQRLG
ncbi:hypothetical protein HYPSUDRAFT_1000895 [Hypholoma sublateritium FD-334 SS-4]|uniref:Uncharacterized protein n=1 Tax=Hypholoma sublateritium (strain FD-334 SS-4) TaxID=945553 RepID=A0A0D2KTE2_HYPSF|nr:hypothetical protein HYPSUDRAFT_1000895 [Hypholoma sublateritium FD-334 SS-4]